jgi:hypothetical protein
VKAFVRLISRFWPLAVGRFLLCGGGGGQSGKGEFVFLRYAIAAGSKAHTLTSPERRDSLFFAPFFWFEGMERTLAQISFEMRKWLQRPTFKQQARERRERGRENGKGQGQEKEKEKKSRLPVIKLHRKREKKRTGGEPADQSPGGSLGFATALLFAWLMNRHGIGEHR